MEAHNLNFLMTTQPAASLAHLRFTISPAILYLVTTRSSAMVCSSSWSLMMNSCADLALHVDSKNPTGGKQGEGPPRQAPFRQVTREAPQHSPIALIGIPKGLISSRQFFLQGAHILLKSLNLILLGLDSLVERPEQNKREEGGEGRRGKRRKDQWHKFFNVAAKDVQ
ncbi:hypothetical protein E2C01_014552 [Portunus trituberculatus]|uniref:Uncharacterized protein n=1 Tax=Portunus trituberculatus TaxID=210409 RepID=A0A5B7DKL6_PORTR|nr:hypothetical protein [Portunus trituberculatus]